MTGQEAALDQALQLHRAGKVADAEMIYRQVLQQDPESADAWCFLGVACREQGRLDEAIAAYRNAIRIQPCSPVAFNNLGNALFLQTRLPEALACFGEAIRRQPDYIKAYSNRSVALQWNGCPAAALEDCRRVVELAPDDVEAHVHLGQSLLLQGQFQEGWSEYAWRLKMDPGRWSGYTQPLWDGSSLDGRTILLVAEQGLGDTVNFIRYAAILKRMYRCRVLVACQRQLIPLLQNCPGIDELFATGDDLPGFDVHAPLLQIPALVGEQFVDVPGPMPYLFPIPEIEEQWKTRLSSFDGFKIGIVWQGNPARRYDAWRSFPLKTLAPLSRLKNICLFSLQKGHGVEQYDDWVGPLEIIPLGNSLDECTGAFVETAAVLKNLDLLITADTAVAHVAGALGVPAWLALSVAPDWRWQLEREDSPWYPSLRLFRQKTLNNWQDVFERMAEELVRLPGIERRSPVESTLANCGMNRLVQARHGLMIYNRYDRYIGRSLELYGEYSEGECELFRSLLSPGQVVVEAGANIGAHTLALSEFVGQSGEVHAFEPQRVIYQMLCANMALNGRTNVHCHCEALAEAPGWMHVPRLNYNTEYNFGGVSLVSAGDGERVTAVTIDSLKLTSCRLIKADVEGMELSVLLGASNTIRELRPLLYIENDREERSKELIEHILAMGYALYWHRTPLFNRANYFRNTADAFAGIVSANMLGVHRSLPVCISGLPEVTASIACD